MDTQLPLSHVREKGLTIARTDYEIAFAAAVQFREWRDCRGEVRWLDCSAGRLEANGGHDILFLSFGVTLVSL